MELTFLGTGGGRFTMIKQLRRTGGMHVAHDDFSLYIDPGPGALVHGIEHGIDLEALDAVLVTHAHLDHCNDMNVLIEAMTSGGDRETGTLLANTTVLHGAELPDKYVKGDGTYGARIDPVLDGFHESLVNRVVELTDGADHDLGPFTLQCLEMEHSDPHTVGVTLETSGQRIGITSDSELFDEMNEFFQGCDVLVLNVMRPVGADWKGHMTTEDAADLLNAVDPEIGILQQFGSRFIRASAEEQKEWLEAHTDVAFVLAEDGMTIDLEQPGLERFL